MRELENRLAKTPLKAIWKSIGIRHHHGFALPLLGIHTSSSCGCGEYLDLISLIDFANTVNFDVIQLLPLNDSGGIPSPYSALSSTALHPIYLSLRKLPDLSPDLEKKLQQAPNIDPQKNVDYQRVLEFKMEWLKAYFDEVGQRVMGSLSYEKFAQDQAWLQPYALYRSLKDHFDQKHWQAWPDDYQKISHTQFTKLCQEHKNEIAFYSFLQFLCFEQLKEVKAYANEKAINLMGDVPILINLDSVNCWHSPHFFDFTYSAGAPPDFFNSDGQNWGFPLYNWPAISQGGYSFWKERLSFAENFYHIYRIDHVIGCFRIWAIKRGEKATKGFYTPSDNELILAQGKEVLTHMMESSNMLPIAEDLGTMPDKADYVLEDYGIPGTRVLCYHRYNRGKGPYVPLDVYDPVNMSTISTHDLIPLKGWYQKYPELVKAFYKMLGWTYEETLTLETQIQLLKLSHQTPTLFHINLLNEYLACIPGLTSENFEDEQINRPGIISNKNWTYRYRLSVEEMQNHQKLSRLMQDLISTR